MSKKDKSEAEILSFKKKLLSVQSELKAPKNQTNTFGKYKYRSCEDILEAVKPLLNKYNLLLTISDSVELIGDRYYIRADVSIEDTDSDANKTAHAYARESLDKKGMDASQITGSSSTYARKYALNALLLIDDTKDADSLDNNNQDSQPKNLSQVDKVKNWIPTVSDLTTLSKSNEFVYKSGDATLISLYESKLKELNGSAEGGAHEA